MAVHSSGPAKAEQHFRAALQQYEKLSADFPEAKRYRYGLATSHLNLAQVFSGLGKTQEADTHFRGALELLQQLVEASPEAREDRERLAIASGSYGEFLTKRGQLEAAEQLIRQSLQTFRDLVAQYGVRGRYDGLCNSVRNLAVLQHRAGRLREAEQTFQESLNLLSDFRQQDSTNLKYINILGNYRMDFARLLLELGRGGEAERLCRLALEDFAQLPKQAEDSDSQITRGMLGNLGLRVAYTRTAG